jgi:hypothetical protein
MSNTVEVAIYTSPPAVKSLWQKYCVYPDRVELDFRFSLTRLIIPASDIISVEIRPPLVIADAFRSDYQGRTLFALKIDLADIYHHVALEKRSGLWRQYRFIPDNLEAFVAACQSIMSN